MAETADSAGSRIAVVVPAHDAEGHLLGALESVAAQHRRPDEVIVVDDGSTDGTAELATEWSKDSKLEIRLVERPGPARGPAAARNEGIRRATAERIALLDADDRFLPHHLQVLERGLAAHPTSVLAFGNAVKVGPDGIEFGRYFDRTVLREEMDTGSASECRPFRGSPYRHLVFGSFIPTCGTLFPREAASIVGMWDESLDRAEDRDFWLRLSRVGAFVYTPRPVARVRYHDDNITHPRHARRTRRSRVRVLVKMDRAADDLALSREEREATRRALFRDALSLLRGASHRGVASLLRDVAFLWRLGVRRPLSTLHAFRCLARSLLFFRHRGENSRGMGGNRV